MMELRQQQQQESNQIQEKKEETFSLDNMIKQHQKKGQIIDDEDNYIFGQKPEETKKKYDIEFIGKNEIMVSQLNTYFVKKFVYISELGEAQMKSNTSEKRADLLKDKLAKLERYSKESDDLIKRYEADLDKCQMRNHNLQKQFDYLKAKCNK